MEATPPLDCIMRMSLTLLNSLSRSLSRSRYSPNTGPTYELMTVALSRSNSLICGITSWDSET